MPLTVPHNLPAIEMLKQENIFTINNSKAQAQDIRPLQVAILNLMPLKIATETDLIRILSNTPLQVEISFIKLDTHQPKNTPVEHLELFYKGFKEICTKCYDGLIITGAPVEELEFTHVRYWDEVCQIFEWAKTHVTSSLYICWAAQAALHHFYNIPKYQLENKLFGVFEHTAEHPTCPLFRGFDDIFFVPHSRHTEIKAEDITPHPDLKILSQSQEAGVYIVQGRGGRELYITGHSEYNTHTLHHEYIRDLSQKRGTPLPKRYYPNDNPNNTPLSSWRSHGSLLFHNWINYYLYQETPFDINRIKQLSHLTLHT